MNMNNTDILVPTEESEVAELEAPAEVVEPGLEPGGDGSQHQQVAVQPRWARRLGSRKNWFLGRWSPSRFQKGPR
ncbi:MAG: hypothetical protein AMJ56_10170 [Anaerolineae bacterium SG8_19]|nr:MAG: hypothetical protein AMJ56_10170 [Anaerolineae bacterium SG8_19]